MTISYSALVTRIISDKIMSIIRKRGRIIKRNNSSILSVNNASSLQKNLRRCNHPLKSLQHSKAIKKYLGTGLHSIDAI